MMVHLPVLFSECPDDGGHREAAYVWLNMNNYILPSIVKITHAIWI